MISKICDKIMVSVRAKMPEVDDERAEVIKFGFELLIGEVPKIFVMIIVGWLLGILKYSILSIVIILPYRFFSGGLHLKSHIGCIIGTTLFYCGIAYFGKIINLPSIKVKLVISILILIFACIMITLYAPADTENIPILRKKERKSKKICSYIVVIIMTIISFVIKNHIISNMIIIAILLQSIMISKFAYDIFKVKLGYLESIKIKKNAI